MKTEVNSYEQQATDFLTRYKIKFEIRQAEQQHTPAWIDPKDPRGNPDHGTEYEVKLVCIAHDNCSKVLTFPFWGSISDRKNHVTPNAYDVLACISGDTNTPDTFKEFCDEYGYDFDSRRAETTWTRCHAFSKQLRAFFTSDELSKLEEIQ